MRWLVVGIGNPLRRDDGLGPFLAAKIRKWELPGVKVREAHQLAPELAMDVAEAENVLFVDATLGDLELRELQAQQASATSLGHALGPEDILRLSQLVEGRTPRAWLAAIPASDFSYGEGISRPAHRLARRALRMIRSLLSLCP